MKKQMPRDLVFSIIQTIPQGKVLTYGAIAKITRIKSARLVGQILHRNPTPQSIPCHRVVFADGSLADKYAFGGKKAQQKKLVAEGVIFLRNGSVDLRQSLYLIKSFSSFLSEAK